MNDLTLEVEFNVAIGWRVWNIRVFSLKNLALCDFLSKIILIGLQLGSNIEKLYLVVLLYCD